MLSTEEQIYKRLSQVLDPEIRRPITELGMVGDIDAPPSGIAAVTIFLTVAHCPLRDTITEDVKKAVAAVPGIEDVRVKLSVMTPKQRAELKTKLQGKSSSGSIPFNAPDSLTKVYAVVSGKGGVGKSTVTVNLAAAFAELGLRVGIVDADIHGFSIPSLMGITAKPTRMDSLILPPTAQGIKVISMGMFVDGTSVAVAWRGPKLHRALEQFLADVHFGDLDVLLLDLPPGTGDIAISVSQLLPHAELLVVTTPQRTAASVAERAGTIAVRTGQKVVGVIENMSAMLMPDGSQVEVFGSGGGEELAQRLSSATGNNVPLLGNIPLDTEIRRCCDQGFPLVFTDSGSEAAHEFRKIVSLLTRSSRGLAGKKLSISPRR